MTVKELIKLLEQQDPDKEVVSTDKDYVIMSIYGIYEGKDDDENDVVFINANY